MKCPRKNMKKSLWKHALGLFLMLCAIGGATANESEIAAASKRFFGLQVTAVRESLIAGFYGINTSPSEIGPRLFLNRDLTVYGNTYTGYSHTTGSRRGQDLSPQEAQDLFLFMLAALKKERLPTYTFGDGSREVLLFTAYDCPFCRALEKNLLQQAKQLNATVYLVPFALRYQLDASSRIPVQNLLCATDRETAWQNLILKREVPPAARCQDQADDYAYLSRAFPVKVPQSVPWAITLASGKIHQAVSRDFAEIFGGR